VAWHADALQVTTTPNPLNQPEKKVVVGVKEYVVPAESA
jgi:hypothetical protein